MRKGVLVVLIARLLNWRITPNEIIANEVYQKCTKAKEKLKKRKEKREERR